MTRSTLSKKMSSGSPNRESERNLKRKESPPYAAVRTKSSKQHKKNLSSSSSSSSSASQQQKPKQQESEEDDVEAEAVQIKRRMNARIYKNMFKNPKRDCNSESNTMDKSTSKGGNSGGGKIDEGFEGNPVDRKEVPEDNKAEEVSKDSIIPSEYEIAEEVSKDGIIPSEDDKTEEVRAESRLSEPTEEQLENIVTLGSWLPSNATTHEISGETERVQSDCCEEDTLEMLESRNSILNKSLIRKCVKLDKGEKSISSNKRKGTMVDMHSDLSATLVNDNNGNLIADAGPSRNTVGTSESCSKRIRTTSLSDVQRNQTKLINNVDQPSSKSEGEKLSTGNNKGKSGDPVERPQSSNDEVRKQQRSLHLLLKPGIAKLCEVLRIPDNVKRMVDNFLVYIMNNRQICTEPVSILQAFQLSLCWTAAALLKHKLDREDSFMLAKQNLNFDCKIEEVYEIHRMMRKLKKDFLNHTGNCNVSGSSKASESSIRIYSNTGVAPKVELPYTDISRSIEVKQLLMQQEEAKKKLTADFEREKADFKTRCKVELAAYLACSRNDLMRTEELKVFNSEFNKRIGELKRQHETQLKDLEAKQFEERWKFQESLPPLESCNGCGPDTVTLVPFSSNAEICDGETSDIPSGDVALAVHKFRSSNDQDEVSTSRPGKLDGTLLSKPVYDCSVETRLNGSKNMVSLNSQSTEEHIPSATTISSPNCENAAQIHEANDDSGSNNVDTLNSPLSVERIASLNSKSPQEHVHSVNAKCMPNCENSAQIYVVGDDNVSDTSNIAATLILPLTDESIADEVISLLDKEVHAEMPGIVSFTDCPENVTAINPILSVEQMSGGVVNVSVSEEQHIDASPLSVSAGQIHGEVPETNHEGVTASVLPCAANCTDHPKNGSPLNSSSIGQISDGVFSSRPPLASSPCDCPATVSLLDPPSLEQQIPDKDSFSIPDGQIPVMVPETNHEVDLIEPLEQMQPLSSVVSPSDQDMNPILSVEQMSGGVVNVSVSEEQHIDAAPLSVSAGQIHGEVPETNHEGVTASVLDREAPVGMPGAANCTDHPENVSPLNSSSIGQISDGVLSSRPPLASSPCDGPATVSLLDPRSLEQQIPDKDSFSIPDGQIPVMVPETNHEIDLIEPLEQVQPLSSVVSPSDQDTNPILSVEQMSGGVVNVSVSEEQHIDAAPLIVSAGQIHGEVPETNHEGVTVSVLDREAPVGMLGAANCTDHPENVSPLNSSSIGQISDGVLSSRPPLASSPCDGPATVSLLDPPSLEQQITDKDSFSIPDGQIPVMVPETNHEVDLIEPLEQVQPLSSVVSPSDQDMNPILSVEQMSGCVVNVSVSDEQHIDPALLSVSAGQIHGEVPETNHEGVTVSVLDREAPVGMPGAANCTDHPENVSPLNSSSMGQISDGVLSSRPPLASSPCDGPATVSILDPILSVDQMSGGVVNVSVSEEQHIDAAPLSVSARQIHGEVPETSHEGVTVSVLDREAPVGMPGAANCIDHPENVSPLNSSSMGQISDGVLSSRPPLASSPCDGPATVSLLDPILSVEQMSGGVVNVSVSEEQHIDAAPLCVSAGQIHGEVPETSHEGVTVSVLDREAPVGMPGAANCTDHPENVSPLNSSSMGQISDGVLSSRPPLASSPCGGPATVSLLDPPSLEQQIPDEDSFSIPDGQIPVMVPETNHEVDLIEPLEQMQPLSSVVSPSDQDTDREMLNSLVSSPLDIVPANQSNHVSPVMEPPEEMQRQSPSVEFLSSNRDLSNLPLATGTEHQPTNEDALSSPIPETSIEVPNQAVEQPASNLELDSPRPGGVRTHSSDTRNFSTASEINQHPIQSATQPASMIVPPLCNDPLLNEVERIRKLKEQTMKNHDDMKLHLNSNFEKELEELRRKYEIKFQEMDVGFQHTRKKLDTVRKTVLLNKILAEAFRCKPVEVRASGAPRVQQGASSAQQLCQLPRLQDATRPSLVSGPSSRAPSAASLLSSYTTTSSQNMVPPHIQATPHNTSRIFSSVSPRLPNINSISSPSGNPHAGGEMRAPAPHLQPYRPSTAVPAPNLGTIPYGMSSQPAPGNIPVISSTFPHRPATYQSDPHRGHRPVNLGVLPTTNLPAMDSRMGANSQSGINMQNVPQRMTNMASLNQSRFGTSSSSMPANPAPHQAKSSDVVCLSDDDD